MVDWSSIQRGYWKKRKKNCALKFCRRWKKWWRLTLTTVKRCAILCVEDAGGLLVRGCTEITALGFFKVKLITTLNFIAESFFMGWFILDHCIIYSSQLKVISSTSPSYKKVNVIMVLIGLRFFSSGLIHWAPTYKTLFSLTLILYASEIHG